MALKRHFTDKEKYGLTKEEIKLGEKWLRKYKTAGRINETESLKLFEMYLIGSSFHDIHQQFQQYPIAQIVMTAALAGWASDRDRMMHTLRDRVQAKVVKSVVEQVDFLTALLGVTNAEHLDQMRDYIMDPKNNPPPKLRVESIKEYKEVVETLYKIVAGATPGSKNKESALFNALSPGKSNAGSIEEDKDKAPNLIDLADDE